MNGASAPARIHLRPLGNSLPLGLYSFGVGMLLLVAQRTGWVPLKEHLRSCVSSCEQSVGSLRPDDPARARPKRLAWVCADATVVRDETRELGGARWRH